MERVIIIVFRIRSTMEVVKFGNDEEALATGRGGMSIICTDVQQVGEYVHKLNTEIARCTR